MPVVFREGGLRYFFFSNEGDPREAVHVHVKGGATRRQDLGRAGSFNRGKLWLQFERACEYPPHCSRAARLDLEEMA